MCELGGTPPRGGCQHRPGHCYYTQILPEYQRLSLSYDILLYDYNKYDKLSTVWTEEMYASILLSAKPFR